MKLSVLIPSLQSRSHFLERVLDCLKKQIENNSYQEVVEIKTLVNNSQVVSHHHLQNKYTLHWHLL